MKTFIVYTIHTYKTSDKYKGYIVKVQEKKKGKEGVKMLDFYHKTVFNYHRHKEDEERSTFHGDDQDYQNPYPHRYQESDSDRGATDEK